MRTEPAQRHGERWLPPGHGEIVRVYAKLRIRAEVLDAVDAMRGDMSRAEFFDFVIDSAVRRAAGLPRQ